MWLFWALTTKSKASAATDFILPSDSRHLIPVKNINNQLKKEQFQLLSKGKPYFKKQI